MEKKHQYQGLSEQQVEESRRQHGENILTPPEKASLWSQFLEKFEDPIIRILLVAWLLSMVIAGVHCWGPEAKGFTAFLEPIGIFFAIMLASCVGFFFEVKANKAFEILNTVNDDILVKVIRDGSIREVPRKEVVVGDIVVLETGEEVPADGHLLEAISLQINESTLTGEPIISKTTNEADFDPEATYPSNVVMRGTTVVDGHGVMEVEKVGDATGYGKVYEGSQIDNNIDTPLQIQLKGLAGVISKAGYTIAGVTFIALTLKYVLSDSFAGTPVMDIIAQLLNFFMVAVTLIVVSVPEGLPMSVTLSLAINMNRMLKTNNLVRKMHACETMGATTVICTDKTGTLTQNQMQVYQTRFYNLKDQTLDGDEISDLIREGISTNSTAFLERAEGKVKALGNPTEAALLLWLDENGTDYAQLRENATVVEQLPFSTMRKFMATVVESSVVKGKRVVYVKGAPEIIIDRCRHFAEGVTKEGLREQLLGYQQKAVRTLGFAYQVLDGEENVVVDDMLKADDLTLMGIVAISDPVRADVPAAVRESLDAGIRIKIVTGDTPGTAKEIGRQIGLWDDATDTDANLITGPDFAALSDAEAAKAAQAIKIMSRARPTDKSRLVSLLQQQGEVVAVTGDGTNDAPALNAAQVGLSMGDGTSVAKEASDITIMDNSFASISRAVMWGRSLYQNIQRFILFQLTVNMVACLIVLIGAFTGQQSPLTVTQMLWVNLIMDSFAALSLASLPPSEAVMRNKPRRMTDFIINKAMKWFIIGVSIVFVFILFGLMQYLRHTDLALSDFDIHAFFSNYFNFSAGDELTRYDLTVFFTFFVFLQFWNLFNAKTFESDYSGFSRIKDCKIFFLTAIVILAGQVLIVNLGGTMFSVTPLSLTDWLLLFAASSVVLWVGELVHLLQRMSHRRVS